MGAIYDQMILRKDPGFRDFVHAAILQVATDIQKEATTVPYHKARVAMANLIVQTNDPKVITFIDRMVFRGIMLPGIRESVVQGGQIALQFADEPAVLTGVNSIWNETAIAVWPTIIADTAV